MQDAPSFDPTSSNKKKNKKTKGSAVDDRLPSQNETNVQVLDSQGPGAYAISPSHVVPSETLPEEIHAFSSNEQNMITVPGIPMNDDIMVSAELVSDTVEPPSDNNQTGATDRHRNARMILGVVAVSFVLLSAVLVTTIVILTRTDDATVSKVTQSSGNDASQPYQYYNAITLQAFKNCDTSTPYRIIFSCQSGNFASLPFPIRGWNCDDTRQNESLECVTTTTTVPADLPPENNLFVRMHFLVACKGTTKDRRMTVTLLPQNITDCNNATIGRRERVSFLYMASLCQSDVSVSNLYLVKPLIQCTGSSIGILPSGGSFCYQITSCPTRNETDSCPTNATSSECVPPCSFTTDTAILEELAIPSNSTTVAADSSCIQPSAERAYAARMDFVSLMDLQGMNGEDALNVALANSK
jgi:hypothetical protein